MRDRVVAEDADEDLVAAVLVLLLLALERVREATLAAEEDSAGRVLLLLLLVVLRRVVAGDSGAAAVFLAVRGELDADDPGLLFLEAPPLLADLLSAERSRGGSELGGGCSSLRPVRGL